MFNIIAIDLGASNGRVIVGKLNDNKILDLHIVYRFGNYGVKVKDSLYWDILRIFTKIKKGLSLTAKKYGRNKIASIGLTSWGVDFVLLDANDEPVGFNHHYRDNRTNGMLEEMFKKVPKKEIFNLTGIQFMPINSSTQLFSMVYNNSPQLKITKTFLMIPDFFNFIFSGVKCSEYTDATTSQLYNSSKDEWAYGLINDLGLDSEWFCNIVQPGTVIGNLHKYICDEVGLNYETKLIAPACHDTGSAVAAVPIDMSNYNEGEWAYLSSGTWSLMGVELNKPLINEKALNYNFTNEGGTNGTIRFLKNLTGMWLIQECKRIWDKEGLNLNYDQIMEMAKNAPPFKSFIDTNDPSFLNPNNMIAAIKEYCEKHSQTPPKSIGEISRTILESLALKYKQTLESIEDITKVKIKILHIIGGGSQNDLLNQYTANALLIPVKAGPIEATAIGNILIQALATKKIKSLEELRGIVRNSFTIKKYYPEEITDWQLAYSSYLNHIKK